MDTLFFINSDLWILPPSFWLWRLSNYWGFDWAGHISRLWGNSLLLCLIDGDISRRQFVLSLENLTVATLMCSGRWRRRPSVASQWQEGSQKITHRSFTMKLTQDILAPAFSMPVSLSITIESDALITMPRIFSYSYFLSV